MEALNLQNTKNELLISSRVIIVDILYGNGATHTVTNIA